MKYRLTFQCVQPVVLPVQYNKIVQAALLTWLGDSNRYASFLHNEGYRYEKRVFKLYTFSKLFGKKEYDNTGKKIIFSKQIQLYLSFYGNEAHELILEHIDRKKNLQLGTAMLPLLDCELVQEGYTDCVVQTVSPVTIHSTFTLHDGRKKTYYYSPFEEDFSEMIRQNLLRKYRAWYQCDLEDEEFEITLEQKKSLRQAVIRYDRFVIKGWNGVFRMSGSPALIKLALLAGIGARNGIGCGCLLQKYTI